MRTNSLCISLLICCLIICSCNNNKDQQEKKGNVDSTVSNTDTTTAEEDQSTLLPDCKQAFFNSLTKTDTANLRLQYKKGPAMAWYRFQKEELMSDSIRWGLKSIDDDEKPELIIWNYTGGAHCCEEIYVFSRDQNRFTVEAKLFGGFICIDPATNVFTFSFNGTLGYFFGCYACSFEDSTGKLKSVREIDLKYQDGRFHVVPYNSDVENQIMTNLQVLKTHGFEDVDEGIMDNGWRKEFAMNLAVWHFNHGKNWVATRKLFDRYYPFKDAKKVWREFYTTLVDAEQENSF